MGRKQKYNTNEERLAAKRESARRSYHKHKGDKITNQEFDRLQHIDPNLFSDKLRLSDEQKQFIHSLINRPIDIQSPTITTRHNDSIANRMIGLAMSKISKKNKEPINSIDFDMTLLRSIYERQYLYEHLKEVIYKLLDSINFNTEKWLVSYEYKHRYKMKPLDEITERYLRNQVENELQEHLHDFFTYTLDYDFFPCGITQISKLHFINLTNDVKRKKREGKFWRWLLKGFPEVNLDKFMIFSKLDKQTVELINKENCFIYACRMSGLDNSLINEMLYSIHKRSISGADISNIAKLCDLKIHIKELSRSYVINSSGKHEIKMVLMHNHYMVDERVNVSPYYIKHKNEILANPKTKFWKREDKMRIIAKEGDRYIKSTSSTFSLRKVIQALFEVDAFVPITMNDYRSFTSLICFENIDPIQSLDYDSNLCCKLKCSKI